MSRVTCSLSLLVVVSSACADHTDPSGAYAGEGAGTYQPAAGPAVALRGTDVVKVVQVSRHYQHTEVEVTVRGCTLQSVGGGETSWGLTAKGGTCTLDLPGVGPWTGKPTGSLSRLPASRSSRVEEMHVLLHADDAAPRFHYSIKARPAR